MRLWHETVQCDERLLQEVRSGGEGGRGGWGWEGIPSSEELEERLYLQATCNFHYNSIEDSHCPTYWVGRGGRFLLLDVMQPEKILLK